ncbi:uncharacterized protein EI90DRAFT_3278902 [Cantharellus anzutake]|uniref:uncharacterized protein n=1 Tax=Cantharellus anzutake TaxID=1750568 RepID=UPI001905AB01|nr:uncharacterized protein EI90DRAFT_3278902 [Cantharellus anzutake]KAF8341215.1 hypothetical protein EI90DRAFT_3278902 [Cantharellus anzutake]
MGTTICPSTHDPLALVLTVGVTIGIIVSYLPQHFRIVTKRSSEGLSPWFLLLGSTSCAAGMLNVVALQWPVIKCCHQVSAGLCLENLGGVFQVVIQWCLFTTTLVLFLVFYPPHLKYAEIQPESEPFLGQSTKPYRSTTAEWKLAVTLFCIVAFHVTLCAVVTALLVKNSESSTFMIWTTFLGLSSALCSAFQFIPQIYKTWRLKLVGSLSIVTMCIQSPGAAVMCLSIAIRPGTNWTSWLTYAAAGCLQSILLTMCLIWKQRQARLGIDDFGRPPSLDEDLTPVGTAPNDHDTEDERSPLLAGS